MHCSYCNSEYEPTKNELAHEDGCLVVEEYRDEMFLAFSEMFQEHVQNQLDIAEDYGLARAEVQYLASQALDHVCTLAGNA